MTPQERKAFEYVRDEMHGEPEQEPVTWRNAAIRVGEELSSVGPDGYYDMTAEQWLDWAMEQQPHGKNSLAQPEQEPSPEWMTEEEQTAYTFGWFKALESKRMAQPEQEPVAWLDEYGNAFPLAAKQYSVVGKHWKPLYTTPPQRKPLTDEQINKAMAENKQTLIDAADNYWKMRRAYARIIEAAHGIKENT